MYGYCPLASGSRGNCILVVTPKAKILVDAGLSGRMTQERLSAFGIELEQIDAILITHEHLDHIRGLGQLAVKKRIPLFANYETARAIVSHLGCCPTFTLFRTGEPFVFRDLSITPFPIQHDAVEPVAFTLQVDGVKLGLCADLGWASALVEQNLQGSHYLYLESNHEPSMVESSSRPDYLKRRILGRSGHLSNGECASLLRKLLHPALRHLHLAHLSSECNSYERALASARKALAQLGSQLPVAVAPQEKPGCFLAF